MKILRHLITDVYTDAKLNKTATEEFDSTFCSKFYLTVKALRTIEKQFDINICNGAINSDECPVDLDESIFKLVRTLSKQKKSENKQDSIEF